MYEAFYQLDNNPFRLAPDPEFCFRHQSHIQAWAYLRYALKQGEGFIVITGRTGVGKTTLISEFLAELGPTGIVATSVAATNVEAADLMRAVAYAWGIDVEGLDKVTVVRRIGQFLQQHRQQGKRALLIVDEAQGLSCAALEELRLLADLRTDSGPLLQVFLVGQEQLRNVMSAPELEQLQQRVIGTCFLEPMDIRETSKYMEHRLQRAGWQGDPELTGGAMLLIYEYSRGVPRHINKIANRLFLYGSLNKKHELNRDDVLTIVGELRAEQLAPLESAQPTPLIVKELEDGSLSLDDLALKKAIVSGPAAFQSVAADSGTEPGAVESPPVWREPGKAVNRRSPQASKPAFRAWLPAMLAVVLVSSVAMMMYRGGRDDNPETGFSDSSTEQLSANPDSGPVPTLVSPPTQQGESRSDRVGYSGIPATITDLAVAEVTDYRAMEVPLPPGFVSDIAVLESVDQMTALQEGLVHASSAADQPAPELQVHEEGIADFLVLAGRSLERNRLLVPANNNAHYYYRKVLEQDPENAQALQGLDRIAERYVILARQASSRQDEEKTRRYVSRGLSVRPDDQRLLLMKEKLRVVAEERRTRALETEQLQAAADVRPDQESLVTRFRDFFDGDKARVERVDIWEEDNNW